MLPKKLLKALLTGKDYDRTIQKFWRCTSESTNKPKRPFAGTRTIIKSDGSVIRQVRYAETIEHLEE